MVKNTGEKNGARAIRSLNEPVSIEVKEGKESRPSSVKMGKIWLTVASIQDMWRIDDEWWRPKPISRMYFNVSLKDQTTTTVFKDLFSEQWFNQGA